MRYTVEQVGIEFGDDGTVRFVKDAEGFAFCSLAFDASGYREGRDESGAMEYSYRDSIEVHILHNMDFQLTGNSAKKLTGDMRIAAIAYLKKHHESDFHERICADAEECEPEYEVAA